MSPTAAPHVCPAPGCRRLAPHGQRCAVHQGRLDARRAREQAFYHSPGWRRLRAQQLVAFPRCSECGAPARVVDHIVPRRQAPDRALDPSNLRSMCPACHNAHTARHGGGWGEGTNR